MHGLATVAGLAHDLEVLLRLDDHAQALADHRLVVDQEDACASHERGTGIVASTTKLPSGRREASSWPPSRSARSRMPANPNPDPRWACGRRAGLLLTVIRRTPPSFHECDRCADGAGVGEGIGKGLLHDPVRCGIERRRQRRDDLQAQDVHREASSL